MKTHSVFKTMVRQMDIKTTLHASLGYVFMVCVFLGMLGMESWIFHLQDNTLLQKHLPGHFFFYPGLNYVV